MKIPPSLKPWLSPLITVSFVIVSVTGLLLYYRVRSRPTFVLHEWFGWLLIVAGAVHLILNLRPLAGYLRSRAGLCSVIASLVLAAALCVWAGGDRGAGGPGRHAGAPSAEVKIP